MFGSRRERCARHGLVYDPRLSRGCALCRSEAAAGYAAPARTLSWLRIGAGLAIALGVFGTLWRYSPVSHWLESEVRARLGIRSHPVADTPGEFDPELWERALRYWEPFELDPQEAPRVADLHVATYVPRDNLASIEGRVTGRRPNRAEVADALHQLDAVLLRYPQRFLRATGFERLVFLCEIVKDGAPVRGFAMPPAKTLVLDPTTFVPGIFHHELFHMVDYRVFGSPGDQPGWNVLNPRGAAYLGMTAYADTLRAGGGLGHSDPSFITDYGRATAAEDRAETFRVLMSEPALAAERRAKSAAIDAKARYIIAVLDRLEGGSSVALGLR